MAEKPGGKIGRYRIIEPIGSGGFATVYRAVDERLGSEVAIKVLAENHSLVPDYRERFISEAQHLRRVDSYWVASIFDLGETETGQPYMVLELADRGDLETRVNNLWDKRRGMERSDLMVLAETLAHSLAAIHSADLVHRDVTPGNLLVRHNGLMPAPWSGRSLLDRGERLMLSDLGYAKDLRAASGITSGGGTAGFAAPEQHGEMTQVDIRADIYGASAVLQWAATGSRHEQALAEVTRIGMAEDPADRYQDMSSWNAAVRSALVGHYAPPQEAAIEEVPTGWARPFLFAVIGLSVGFIVAALLFDGDGGAGEAGPAASTSTSVASDQTAASATTTPIGFSPPLPGSREDGITPHPLTDPPSTVSANVVKISMDEPAAGSIIDEQLVISGTAEAVEGLQDVQIQIVFLLDNAYLDLASGELQRDPLANRLPLVGAPGDETAWRVVVDSETLNDGTYVVRANATDQLGQQSPVATARITIDRS